MSSHLFGVLTLQKLSDSLSQPSRLRGRKFPKQSTDRCNVVKAKKIFITIRAAWKFSLIVKVSFCSSKSSASKRELFQHKLD